MAKEPGEKSASDSGNKKIANMRSIYFHEDDYCQIEILPVENLGFCLKQAGLIDEFSEEHKAGAGYTDMFIRGENPLSIYTKSIPVGVFEEALEVAPKYDEVFTGYSSYCEKCESTNAFGHQENVAVFYEEKDGFVKNIWLALDIYEDNDVSITYNMLTSLAKLGDFIIVDWGWGFIEELHDAARIKQYLQKRLEVFTDSSDEF